MVTGATLFTGGGGVDLGMRSAGIETAWGIEYDPQIAEVARANGVPVTVLDILDANPTQFERVDVLHASPPCPNFSTANVNASETQHDIDLAHAVGCFIRSLTPSVFTLENVYAYRKSRGFKSILSTLRSSGYWYVFDHVNSADYGVPQTRRRLILRAARHSLLMELPSPELWTGWYEAIADLIDDLPDSELAPWQKKRLPAEVQSIRTGVRDLLMMTGATSRHPDTRGTGIKTPGEPANTVTPSSSAARAILVSGAGSGLAACVVRDINEPAPTVVASEVKRPTRLILVGDQSARAGNGVQIRMADEPAMTVRAGSGGGSYPRAIDDARVVSMTPRALARFQSFPDSYELPDASGLACRVLGNAVPPLMYQKIVRQLVPIT